MQFVVKHTDGNMAPLWDIAIPLNNCHSSLTPERVCSTVPGMIRIFAFENSVRVSEGTIYIRLTATVEAVMKFQNALGWLQNPNVH